MKMNIANLSSDTRRTALADITKCLAESCDSLEWLSELVRDAHVLLASIKDDMEPMSTAQVMLYRKMLHAFHEALAKGADSAMVAEQENIVRKESAP